MELMERRCVDIAMRHNSAIRDPLEARHDWYLIVEIAEQGAQAALEARLLAAVEAGLENGELLEGASYKHDVSVPVSQVPHFIAEADAALAARLPGIRSFAFGHLGDGNIHYNPLQAEGGDRALWQSYLPEVNLIVHDIVARLGGSITAERGIGRLRINEVPRYKSAVEKEMMRRLKQCFDPQNLMNPGKLLTDSGTKEE